MCARECVGVCVSLVRRRKTQINPGGDIPEEYYLLKLMENVKKDMDRVTIPRGSTHLVSFTVEQPGTILK